jgi:hypothetical protein
MVVITYKATCHHDEATTIHNLKTVSYIKLHEITAVIYLSACKFFHNFTMAQKVGVHGWIKLEFSSV